MRLILSGILTLRQHLDSLEQTPQRYRPTECHHCHETVIWRYGYYYRKSDRLSQGEDSLNDIPIPRFQCADCRRTFSTLPECIAPRRWYPWLIQQGCLLRCLIGGSIRQAKRDLPMARSTISRWCQWLSERFREYHPVLCAQVASMGYFSIGRSFWTHWFHSHSLSHAMVLLNQAGVIVP